MDAAQHLVKLKPIAIELVDATMIGLASEIAMFRPTLDAFLKGGRKHCCSSSSPRTTRKTFGG